MPFCVRHRPKVRPVIPAPAMVIGDIDMAAMVGMTFQESHSSCRDVYIYRMRGN